MSEIVYLAGGQGAPEGAKDLAAKAVAPRRVQLAWGPSPTPAPAGTATVYVVKRSKTPGGGHVPLAPGLPVTSFTDFDAEPGATYSYVVTAVNTGGESGPSNEITVTIPTP